MELAVPLYADVLDRRLPQGFGSGWTDAGYEPEGGDIPPELELLWACESCRHEVNNGGFVQFFMNDTGMLAPEAALGFRLIGLADCAECVSEAMEYFGEPYPRSQPARESAYFSKASIQAWLAAHPESDSYRSPFEGIDERFYTVLMGDRFKQAADEFARQFA